MSKTALGLKGVKERLFKGIAANIVNKGIVVLTRIILPPLFLKTWGVIGYGEWLLLSSVVAYLSFADLGGQTYIINRMIDAYSRNDM
ncbi:hypothetical protein ACFL6K_04635, partial [Candidatus Latescibacterota bacterium]